MNESWCGFGQPMYKILEVSGSTVTKAELYYPYKDKTAINGLGLYSTSTNTKNSALTYYFRGDVLNNYVQFAGTLWRIIRITEDGYIRMIKETASANSLFNETGTDKMYVGYMYGTSASPYTNTTNSTIKTKLESIASTNLTNYSSYLANTETCNDRKVYSTGGSNNVFYGAYGRLRLNRTPKFACTQSTDLFTANAGLISADEIAYAGGVFVRVSDMYLNNNTYWWSASPDMFYSSTPYVYYISNSIVYISHVVVAYGVRPVVSLKASVLTLGGSGTVDDPYIVTSGGSWTNS